MNYDAETLQVKAARRRVLGFGGLLILCALFAAIIVDALVSTAERRRIEALHLHTLDVLMVSGRLETEINGALRGERGYLITGDRAFLEPYFEGRSESFGLAAHLRTLTRDNAMQRRNLADFDRRLREFFATLSRLIELQDRGRHEEAVRLVKTRIGRNQAIELLGVLHRIEGEERRLLDVRRRANAEANDRIELNNYVFAFVGGLLMVLVIGAMIGAARAHRRSLEMGVALHLLATTDALTGLPNRRQLMAALELETTRARRTGRPLAVALLDVDRFKSVNDTHGHAAGDEVLRVVADELRRVTRGGDVLGRYGGEEFAILMPETQVAEARQACERLRAAIARRTIHYPDGTVGRVTVSAGVALLSGGEDISRLIARADAALYEAKSDGRNLVRLAA